MTRRSKLRGYLSAVFMAGLSAVFMAGLSAFYQPLDGLPAFGWGWMADLVYPCQIELIEINAFIKNARATSTL